LSVPGGAGDEEANIVQRPPGTRFRLGPLRGLGRPGLGLGLGLGLRFGLRLHLLRGALTAAQPSAHGLAPPEPRLSRIPAPASALRWSA